MAWFSGWGKWFSGWFRKEPPPPIAPLAMPDVPDPASVFHKDPPASSAPLEETQRYIRDDDSYNPAETYAEFIPVILTRGVVNGTPALTRVHLAVTLNEKGASERFIAVSGNIQPIDSQDYKFSKETGSHDSYSSPYDNEKGDASIVLIEHLKLALKEYGMTFQHFPPGYPHYTASNVLYILSENDAEQQRMHGIVIQELRKLQNEFERTIPLIDRNLLNMQKKPFAENRALLRLQAQKDHLPETISSIVHEHLGDDERAKKLSGEIVTLFNLHAVPKPLQKTLEQRGHTSRLEEALGNVLTEYVEDKFRKNILSAALLRILQKQENRELGS